MHLCCRASCNLTILQQRILTYSSMQCTDHLHGSLLGMALACLPNCMNLYNADFVRVFHAHREMRCTGCDREEDEATEMELQVPAHATDPAYSYETAQNKHQSMQAAPGQPRRSGQRLSDTSNASMIGIHRGKPMHPLCMHQQSFQAPVGPCYPVGPVLCADVAQVIRPCS